MRKNKESKPLLESSREKTKCTISSRKHTNLSNPQDEYKKKKFNFTINTKYLCEKDNQCKCKVCYSLYTLNARELFDVFKKLDNYREWTWERIETHNGTSCGAMQIESLDENKMIKTHLQELKKDPDVLYKMEIAGKHRVWGIREYETFVIIWNDENHNFYQHRNKNYTQAKNKL